LKLENCKAAVVHHWLLSMTGGEKVCEAVCELLGHPDVFSLLAEPAKLSPILQRCGITTSFVQRMPAALKYHRYYAWLFPMAVELFDLTPYDLVISSDANTMKGVITRPETCHVCYCHSPMRYAWNMFPQYRAEFGTFKRGLLSVLMHYLRLWDHAASARVDYFVANSQTVKNRIGKYYRRSAKVIHPPCDVDRFHQSGTSGDYYLCVSRFVGYKRLELAVQAFTSTGRKLVVVGTGPEAERLKSLAGRNVEFPGVVPDQELDSLYEGCKAFVFPGEEDFGIVMVEAQAAGKPVIAYGKGGAAEIILPDKTGVLFHEQSVAALIDAVEVFEHAQDRFDPVVIRANAQRFSRQRFQEEFGTFAQRCLNEHREAMQDGRGRIS
jgi:glycosyltransferase involved in cell wall biosynthesis